MEMQAQRQDRGWRRVAAVVAVAGAVLGAVPAHAQAQAQAKGIPGFLNPKTGAFTVVPDAPAQPELAVATYGGTFSLRFTITIVSGGSSTAPITCSGQASTFIGSGTYTNYYETKSVKATRNGSTATCLVSIPYSWQATGSNTVSLSYTVSLTDGSGLTISRTSSANLASFLQPANGATTVREIRVTL